MLINMKVITNASINFFSIFNLVFDIILSQLIIHIQYHFTFFVFFKTFLRLILYEKLTHIQSLNTTNYCMHIALNTNMFDFVSLIMSANIESSLAATAHIKRDMECILTAFHLTIKLYTQSQIHQNIMQLHIRPYDLV